MKPLLAASVALYAVAILAQARSEEAKGGRQYAKDEKLYEAVVSGRTIAIFYSLEPFSPGKHKITRVKFDGQLDPIAVDDKTLVGSWDERDLKEGIPRLIALHVMFGDLRVDVPPDILQPVSFFPVNAKFTAEHAATLVYVSSDAKTVALEFRGGQPVALDEGTEIAIADNGRVTSDALHGHSSRVLRPPTPDWKLRREFMAIIQDPDGYINVRDGQNGPVIAKLKTGERFIAIENTSDDWWRVILPSGAEGVIHRSRIHRLPEEPLIKRQMDSREFFQMLKTNRWDNDSAPGYPANYIAAIRKAVSGNLKSLGQLFEAGRFKYDDNQHSPNYQINWTVFHLVGDETFAKFLRGQTRKRVEEIADKFSDESVSDPVSEPLPYMQRHFPKSYELLYPGRSEFQGTVSQQEYARDKKFYEATVAGKPIALFYSEQPFELPKQQRKYDPKVPGTPQLSALYVMFGDKRVDVPAEYLRNIFCPWMETRFIPATRYTVVSISSDAKTVFLQIADRSGPLDPFHWYALFTMTDKGAVISRSPVKDQPAVPSKAFMAIIDDSSGSADVRYTSDANSGTETVKNGERLIAAAAPKKDWWKVWLASGHDGFVAGKSVHVLPDEPLMSIRYDGENVLEHQTFSLDHAGALHDVNYESIAKSAVAGDADALAHLVNAGPMMDGDSIEPYWNLLWIVMHRLGDEGFARVLAQQPRHATDDIRRGFTDASITAPFFDSSSYLKDKFPKTYAILFP
jgi:hypothetical protein